MIRDDFRRIFVEPFEIAGFDFIDVRTLDRLKQSIVNTLMLESLLLTPIQVRCEEANDLADCTRGDLPGLNFGIYDTDGKLISGFNFHGVNIVSESGRTVTVRARFMPAFRLSRRLMFGQMALLVLDYMLETGIDLRDGRHIAFDRMEYTTFTLGDGENVEQSKGMDDAVEERRTDFDEVRTPKPGGRGRINITLKRSR